MCVLKKCSISNLISCDISSVDTAIKSIKSLTTIILLKLFCGFYCSLSAGSYSLNGTCYLLARTCCDICLAAYSYWYLIVCLPAYKSCFFLFLTCFIVVFTVAYPLNGLFCTRNCVHYLLIAFWKHYLLNKINISRQQFSFKYSTNVRR